MSTSFLSKIAIAAAATMLTLSPALADRGGHGRSHHVERKFHGHSGHHHHFHKHAKKHRHFRFYRHWSKPRIYYGHRYNSHRRWY